MVLRDQIAIYKKEFRLLGKRPALEEPEIENQIEDAVIREIKRRRKPTCDQEQPITLQEKRARDRARIEEVMRSSKPLLAHWDEILAACINDK